MCDSLRIVPLFHALAALLAAAAMPVVGPAQVPAPPSRIPLVAEIDPAWGTDGRWDDGRAEVAVYEAVRVVDGAPRLHQVRLVTVAEEFNTEFWTRAEWPHGQKPIRAVLRQTQSATVESPRSVLHTSVSIVRARDDFGRLVKLTASSHDGVGATTKEVLAVADPPTFHFISYWDGEGTGRAELEEYDEDTFFEEELPVALRGLRFRDGLSARFSLMPSQVTSRAAVPVPVPAVLDVAKTRRPFATPHARYGTGELWEVHASARDGREITWWFEAGAPHVLVSMEHGDGRRMDLVELERRAPGSPVGGGR